ncbi:MAG: hypothetical protein SO041_00595 [Dysosmobacter sp.]|nr:hypothetical protein [Dysosmobacter sp.]
MEPLPIFRCTWPGRQKSFFDKPAPHSGCEGLLVFLDFPAQMPVAFASIVAYLDTLKDKYASVIEKLDTEIQSLIELKARLVSDVVTGQIDVRDIEIPDYEFVEDEADNDTGDDGEEYTEEQED